jgi:hypothetical protein
MLPVAILLSAGGSCADISTSAFEGVTVKAHRRWLPGRLNIPLRHAGLIPAFQHGLGVHCA